MFHISVIQFSAFYYYIPHPRTVIILMRGSHNVVGEPFLGCDICDFYNSEAENNFTVIFLILLQ
jgi:hypothetical protein